MGHKEGTKSKGWITLTNIKPDGSKEEQSFSNITVNTGKAQLAALFLADVGGTAFDYVAVGTDSTAPNVTDSALGGELYRSASTCVRTTTTVTDDTAYMTGSFAITGSATINEIGIFNSSSGGVMYSRATGSGQVVTDGDTLNYTYSVQFT